MDYTNLIWDLATAFAPSYIVFITLALILDYLHYMLFSR